MVDEFQRNLMERHLDMVIEMNKILNLTRIDDRKQGQLLHIEDSLTGLKEVEDAPEGLLGDMGSGGGFPGLPLAISSGRRTTLIEARKKKCDALQHMVNELELSDAVEVFCGRAELLARRSPLSYAVITARALAKLSVLMELASPLLQKNGLLVCYKAHVEKEEYDDALRVQPLTGMALASDREVVIGDGSFERRIVCFRKERKPEIKLPRKEGMAQKHPL